MHGLNRIFSKPSQLLVMRVLFHADEPLTGREVERRTGLSNRAAMVALESLSDLSVVQCETAPNAHYYELNQKNYFCQKVLKPLFDAEDLFWEDLRKTIRRLVHPRPIAALVTGPVAREESAEEGRLDLIMLFSNGRNRLRAFPSTQQLDEEIWDRYALEVSTVLIDLNTADDEEYEPLWRRVEREGVLLYGTLP